MFPNWLRRTLFVLGVTQAVFSVGLVVFVSLLAHGQTELDDLNLKQSNRAYVLRQEAIEDLQDFLKQNRISSVAEVTQLRVDQRNRLRALIDSIDPVDVLAFHGRIRIRREIPALDQPRGTEDWQLVTYFAEQIVVSQTDALAIGQSIGLDPEQTNLIVQAHALIERFHIGSEPARRVDPFTLSNALPRGRDLALQILSLDQQLSESFKNIPFSLHHILDLESLGLVDGLVCNGLLKHFQIDSFIEPYVNSPEQSESSRTSTVTKQTEELRSFHIDLETVGLLYQLKVSGNLHCPHFFPKELNSDLLAQLEIEFLNRQATLKSMIELEKLARSLRTHRNREKHCDYKSERGQRALAIPFEPPSEFPIQSRSYGAVGQVEGCDLQYDLTWSHRRRSFSGVIRSLLNPHAVMPVCFADLPHEQALRFVLVYVGLRQSGRSNELEQLGNCKN